MYNWILSASLPMCHILSGNRVTKSVSAPLGFSPNCKMCVRDTKSIILSTIYAQNIFDLAKSLNGRSET